LSLAQHVLAAQVGTSYATSSGVESLRYGSTAASKISYRRRVFFIVNLQLESLLWEWEITPSQFSIADYIQIFIDAKPELRMKPPRKSWLDNSCTSYSTRIESFSRTPYTPNSLVPRTRTTPSHVPLTVTISPLERVASLSFWSRIK